MEKKRIFSPEQESAITTRDRTLLVSAAAGSGKTTTLTERIIRSLLDEDHPESILDMLIVTFTNASVLDLKEKISNALTAAALEHPENKRLEDELRALGHARIMTIDSFCAELVKTNAERLGITPLYRVSEGAETLILERGIIDAEIERAFRGEIPSVDAEKFEKLGDALTGVKNTASLGDVLIALYEKTKSMVKETSIFTDFANNYLQYSKEKPENTIYVRYVMDTAKETLLHFPAMLDHYRIPLLDSGDTALFALADDLTEICDRLNKVANANYGYEELRERIQGFTFPKAPTIKNPKPDEALRAISYRQDIKNALANLYEELLSYSTEEWQKLYADMAEYVGTLAAFLDEFSTVYFEEKRRRGCLEFSDIERLAYDALYKDGELTEVALEFRSQLTSVYIDEYQDVNELQNKIFEAVSPPDKRFMVGDIKQSIYGFRSARPEIFANMKKSFPPLSQGYNVESSIFMSDNYRCDKGIVDYVNELFDRLFGAVADSIGYVSEDRLVFKKKTEGEAVCEPPVIYPIERPYTTAPAHNEEGDGSINFAAEANFVAAKIEELLKCGKRRDGSPIVASDIAIIMKTKKSFATYEAALRERGILATAAEDRDFFMNKEILLTLSLLSSIDNPRKDIYLASLMCSPLYGFSADELYVMKTEGGAQTLYDSLLEYQKNNPEFAKLNDFLSKLSHYRALCEGMNIDVLLTRLYRETGLLALASRQGGQENLYKLYSYARKFEGSAYKGLYNFIAYVNTLIERGAKIDKTDGAAKAENAVTIGTIHSSKGLEFPVVFLANANAPLTNLDLRQRIAFSEDFGISFLLRGPAGLALVENPLQKVVFDYMDKKFCEEAIRLFYVALTRAKEKLYIVGELKAGTAEKYLLDIMVRTSHLTPYSVRRLKSYMDMAFSAADFATVEPQLSEEKAEGENEENTVTESEAELSEPEAKPEEEVISEDLEAKLNERFSYVYPMAHMTVMPEKISVSRLYPTVLDGADEGETALFTEKKEKSEPVPRFISGTPDDESARRGIATHNFLQFFDLESLKAKGSKSELERLTEKGFLSEKTAALVRTEELALFERSELFEAMQKAKNLYREFRFNARLPAELFTASEDKKSLYKGEHVLVQGVIDCLIENEDGTLRLVDYKTDRLSKAELQNEDLARKKLFESHSLQLSYYALAVEKIFGKRPERIEVYSMPLGKTVSVMSVAEQPS